VNTYLNVGTNGPLVVSGTGNGITVQITSDGSVSCASGSSSYADGITWDIYCGGSLLSPGCTDPAACNYDETANDDNGSCEYALEGFDCDGNSTSTCNDEAACNYGDVAECTYALEGFDCDGNEITCSTYTVSMTDTYGDGWNQNLLVLTDSQGNSYDLTMYDVNGEFTTTEWTTFDEGYALSVDVCLEDGCVGMEWFDGQYTTETAFTITNAEGDTLASGEDGILSQEVFGANDDSCVTEGCTDPIADNYFSLATIDDGSCYYSCPEGTAQVDVLITTDTYADEIGFTISDDDGNVNTYDFTSAQNLQTVTSTFCFDNGADVSFIITDSISIRTESSYEQMFCESITTTL